MNYDLSIPQMMSSLGLGAKYNVRDFSTDLLRIAINGGFVSGHVIDSNVFSFTNGEGKDFVYQIKSGRGIFRSIPAALASGVRDLVPVDRREEISYYGFHIILPCRNFYGNTVLLEFFSSNSQPVEFHSKRAHLGDYNNTIVIKEPSSIPSRNLIQILARRGEITHDVALQAIKVRKEEDINIAEALEKVGVPSSYIRSAQFIMETSVFA